MNAKQGFHWKTIENKPENWEKLHNLIQNSYIDINEERDKYWSKNEIIIQVLLELYPDLNEFFQEEIVKEIVKTKNKKNHTNKAQEIKNKNEKELIKKDLQNIRFDKNLKPLNTNFSMEISFVIMIFVWNFYLQKKPNVDQYIYLDGIISLNRIIDIESESLKLIPRLNEAILNLKNMINLKINENMYSLLFENPILLVESTADKRKKSIKLYKEQKTILNKITTSIILDEPLIVGNQMPTGTGKSFLAVPLAQKINKMKRGKTVLFACSNELVNQDIASTALLGDDIHLWMSSLIRDEDNNTQVLLRPYKRCFPVKWKSVYKEKDENKIGSITEQWNFYVDKTGKNPDIIVADLEACYELLKNADEIDNPFIAYIDEFISDTNSNKMMAKIAKYLPKHTILLSAILPQFDSMKPIIQYFCEKYECEEEDCLYRVETNNIPITCAVIDQDGKLRMPHHVINTQDELINLITEMKTNPRIRRCYTAKHVYYWSKTLKDVLKNTELEFHKIFPNIGKIKNINIVEYAISLLDFLKDNFDLINKFKEYAPQIMDAPNSNKIFTENAYNYEGKTLYISNDTFKHLYEASADIFDKEIKYSSIIDKINKNEQERDSKLDKLKKMKIDKKAGASFSKLDRERKIMEIYEESTMVYLPNKYVINSKEHYKQFHNDTNPPKNFIPRTANVLPDIFSDGFTDYENLLLSAGIGFYDKLKMTSYQRNLIMSIYKNLCFICSCKDIVFGTNLPNLVNVFISKEFAMSNSIPILYQLMGRVGRMGKSFHANIILDDENSVQKILSLDSNIDNQDVVELIQDFLNYI